MTVALETILHTCMSPSVVRIEDKAGLGRVVSDWTRAKKGGQSCNDCLYTWFCYPNDFPTFLSGSLTSLSPGRCVLDAVFPLWCSMLSGHNAAHFLFPCTDYLLVCAQHVESIVRKVPVITHRLGLSL